MPANKAIVVNPMYVDPRTRRYAGQRGQSASKGNTHQRSSSAPESFFQRHSGKAKVIIALGVVGLVGIIGFVAAGGNAGSESAAPPSELESAKQSLSRQLSGRSTSYPVLQNLTIGSINALLDSYESNPGEWSDRLVPESVVLSLKAYRDEAIEQRKLVRSDRNLEATSVRGAYRRQLNSLNQGSIKDAWERIENEGYSSPVQYKDDRVQVRREGSVCWVIAEETNSAGDWWNNLNFGSEDIMSLKKYNTRAESCGCEKKTLWYCSTYKYCSAYKKIGEGYDGFTITYNAMRINIWNKIKSVCGTGLSSYHFAGYSRGGGLLNNVVFAILNDGLISKSKVKLTTFGSPRALSDSTSDKLHGWQRSGFAFDRVINQADIVPSIPYDWWGFKHAGELSCYNCDYPTERDRPFYAWSINHHTEYCQWFGDQRC